MMRLPVGLKLTLVTQLVCLSNVRSSLPLGHVPELHRLVIAGRGKTLTVVAESHAADLVGVAGQSLQQLAGRGFPDLHAVVAARRGQFLAVGLKATLRTPPVCPSRVRIRTPVWAFHSLTVLSSLAVARMSPAGAELDVRHFIGVADELDEAAIRRCGPATSSRSRPSPAETRCCPSGLKATLRTPLLCPRMTRMSLPACMSQSLQVWSSPAETRFCPSLLKETLLTALPHARMGQSSRPVTASHTFTPPCAPGRDQPFAVGAEGDAQDGLA